MKKILIAILTLCISLSLALTALANDNNGAVANSLYSLGLINGYDDSGSDFGLADGLTRAQAVVIIERYLGVAEKAESFQGKAPFSDIPEWAASYVAYAVENKLVSGKKAADGTMYFDPDAKMSETEFLTLLLRAMEYTDKNDGSGDFIWSDPFVLASSIGLIENIATKANFLRGDAFAICYNALASKCKGGKTVSEKLIADNIITEKAYGYAKRIAQGETIVVACVGDSITEGAGSSNKAKYSYPANLQKLLGKGFQVVNCGKSSAYVMDLESQYNIKSGSPALWYPNTQAYKTLKGCSPDIVIVMLGTNDARSMTVPEAEADFVKSYKELIADIKSMESKPEIYLSTMIPAVNADTTHEGTVYTIPGLIKDIAKELSLPLIDTAETLGDYYNVMLVYGDKVHPKDNSYPALAVNMYNNVFGHSKALPEIPLAKDKVVFVSSSGKLTNGGTSPADAVDLLSTAIAMLREDGGTVVVCGDVSVPVSYFVECKAPIKITSVYNGADYREYGAKLTISGLVNLGSDTTIENITLHTTGSYAISCRYNNFTVGEGVLCTGTDSLAINVGYRLGSGAFTPELASCTKDCTIRIASGRWSILRGGNMRTSPTNPIGTVKNGAKLSIYISGGEFDYKGVNATALIGMNGCDGDAYLNISGGKFVGGVYGVHRTGTNQTGAAAQFNGNLTMEITGGEFGDTVGLYHTKDTPKVKGDAILIVAEELVDKVNTEGFTDVKYVK